MWQADGPAFEARNGVLAFQDELSKSALKEASDAVRDSVFPTKVVMEMIAGASQPAADDIIEACDRALTRLQSAKESIEAKDKLTTALEALKASVADDAIRNEAPDKPDEEEGEEEAEESDSDDEETEEGAD